MFFISRCSYLILLSHQRRDIDDFSMTSCTVLFFIDNDPIRVTVTTHKHKITLIYMVWLQYNPIYTESHNPGPV